MPCDEAIRHYAAMVKHPPPIALKLDAEMERLGTTIPEMAALFGVKVPSVYDWLNFGRIAKKHLPRLAQWSGRQIDWWINDDALGPALAARSSIASKKKTAGSVSLASRKTWPFSVSYELYDGLSSDDKKALNAVIRAFVVSKSTAKKSA